MEVYITLDYELAMGNVTGTPECCLIEPMNHLTAMLDKYGVKVNIFVDAAYLLQLRKLKEKQVELQKDYDLVTGNVRQLAADGHSIQLHLHPQWLYSSYDGRNWTLDKAHYKLEDMPLEEQKQIIHDGVELLNSMTPRKVNSFRAGGYSLENFSELYETFVKEGIINDSSVVKGEYRKGIYHSYDYRHVPSKTPYSISDSLKIENKEGKMTEYRVSTIELSAVRYLINKYFGEKAIAQAEASRTIWGNGVGIGYPGNKIQIIFTKLKMLFGNRSICPYIEVGDDLEKVYRYYQKNYPNDSFVMIGHPKVLSPYAIEALESFINNHPEAEFVVF